MLKVLIVDDEPMVREGLKSIIQWDSYGFYICGEGVDGRDGLNKIIELKPDLVLMDIRMPGIYGIELISEAKQRGFKGKIIILTGYSDFGYAQNAIRLEVNDYLLKPIDEDELIKSIVNISEVIQEELQIKTFIDYSRNTRRNNVITDIIMGGESLLDLDRDLDEYNLNFKFSSYQIILFDISFYKASKIESDKKIEENYISIRENLNFNFNDNDNIEIFNQDSRLGLIFKGQADIFKVSAILKRLNKEWFEKYGANTFIALGDIVNNIGDISVSYLHAREVLKNRFIYEERVVLSWDELSIEKIALEKQPETIRINHYIDRIYTFVEIGDMDNLDVTFNEIALVFKKLDYEPEKIKGLCIDIFIEFKKEILLNYKELKDDFSLNEDIVNDIYDQRSLDKLMEYLNAECRVISNKICNSSSENIMKRILSYIEKNYYKDLKLRLLGEIFNYNSAYLGKMFKMRTGEEFNVYLDKIRIENAKILLNENNLMVYEVSERVGYKNVDYFYCKFKKYVGVSPKEYKKIE